MIPQFDEAMRRSLVGDRRLETHDEEEGDKTIGVSAMPLCGIVLPPSEKSSKSYHAVLLCGPSSLARVVVINLIIQINPIEIAKIYLY